MTITEKICFNVKYLLKQKDIPIGQFETDIGKQPGFFARRNWNGSTLNIEVVYKISQVLGVSIDVLCSDMILNDIEESLRYCGYKMVPLEDKEEENDS